MSLRWFGLYSGVAVNTGLERCYFRSRHGYTGLEEVHRIQSERGHGVSWL